MKAKDVVEVALLYVGVPAVTLYPLGFIGLFIQLWRDNFFPYYDFNMIWNAVAMALTPRSWGRVSNFCIFPRSLPYWG